MRKTSSSNAFNERELNENCGMSYALSILGGRWKPAVLWQLLDGKKRYSVLRKAIPNVSERMLVSQLRELENDGILRRIVYAEVPPRVEYELTELGLSMQPVLQSISDWGNMHRDRTPARGQ